jgi:outer membrane usher protein
VAAAPVLRLETSWSYSDDDTLRSYRAGDIMTGSLTWTRPVRMAGLQVQRNFALRPDIVTMPLPAARGSAAVPSTVDVYVDNVKTYSGAIGAGPFVIDNLPAGSGRTAATVVVTDVTGRRSEQRLEVVNVPELLRKGLVDYSLEAGLVRRSFGSRSFDYGHDPAASATLRAGLTDRLTVEGHGELTSRLINGGAGGYLPLGSGLGVVNGGLAVSAGPDGAGASVFAAWRGNMGPLALQVAASRSFGSFADLASVFSTSQTGSGAPLWSGGGIPRAQLRAALSYHWQTVNADLRASLVRTTRQGGAHELTATAGLSKSFGKAATVFADGFAGNRHDYGASLGVSFPLGHHALGSSLVRVSRQGGVTGWAQAQKAAEERPGSYGWRVGRTAGEAADTLEASAVYRGSLARLEAGATQQAGAVRLRATADGSLVVADGGLFLAGTTGEAYAVVDAGAPNVPVLLENQVIGKTGKAGKLLVPGLSAYQKSRLSLDVRSLPVTAVIPSTEMVVVPRDHSGVTAEFGVRAQAPSAVVIVVDEAGHALPAGTPLALSGAPAAFFVGYEGRAFVTGLAAANRITAELAGGSCSGSFAFAPEGDTQQVLGPVTCRLAQ